MSTPYTASELRALIQEVLKSAPINLWSQDAEELLLATCAQESLMGKYREQIPPNPDMGMGIFQEERSDFNDLMTNFVAYHADLLAWVNGLFDTQPPSVDQLINNDKAAIAICRLHYYRVPAALPSASDVTALWHYYKTWYNSIYGAATEQEFMNHFNEFVANQ